MTTSRRSRRRESPIALTIAGSDSGGGAGIQADLKTFAAHGVYGASVVTAVTAQNTVAVTAIEELTPAIVRHQLDAVASDLQIDGIKTGMLSSSKIISAVVRKLSGTNGLSGVPVVVDPVMVSKSGHALLAGSAVRALREKLLPLASVVTPNLPEAAVLVGFELDSMKAWRQAAKEIAGMGAAAVVIKGGHGSGDEVVDLLYTGRRFRSFSARRIHSSNTHGTGCTFSAALCALLARGYGLEKATERAKQYLHQAIETASPIGRGHSPVHHLVGQRRWSP